MHRRRFIALLGAAITAARTLRAQQKAMPVVGILNLYSRPPAPLELSQGLVGPVVDGLREAGYIAGRNVTFEYRFAGGHYDILPALAADLVD
jgi:putative ABC transport system substrate-binding protein